MNFLAQNIKYLRRKNHWTQQQLADLLEIKRALIGSYEEGRATPKIAILQRLTALANLSIDDLLGADLEKAPGASKSPDNTLQILPIVVNSENEELIPIVPVKASAGYLNGFSDPEFIETLPRFSMPIPELSKERTYRVFQIKGDSMLPVSPGSYIFCEFVPDGNSIKDGQTYILITKDDGLAYKRVFQKEQNQLLLKSDNPDYDPYLIEADALLEIWKARGILSFDLPKAELAGVAHISSVLNEVKNEIRKLRNS
jgi:transcriptional regulator with XRE-family HTH domain